MALHPRCIGRASECLGDDGTMDGAVHGAGGAPIAGWFLRENLIEMDDNYREPYFRTPRTKSGM